MFAPLGCGTGGSTSLYAAQLERLQPTDFTPRQNYSSTDSTLPEKWPISYEELLPYYRRAETLYEVRGSQDPLQPDSEAPLQSPPELSERDQHIFEALEESGLHPYRAHVGCRFVDGCVECGGRLCPRGCRSDAGRICVLPAVTRHGARVLTGCEALELLSDSDRVSAVRCRWGDREVKLRGRVVVLAAGSWMTPTLLLKSKSERWPDGMANSSGLVGRNLMLHTSDFFAVRPRAKNLSKEGPRKAISANDFYVYEGQKLGTLQSVGINVHANYVLYYLKNLVERDPRWWLRLGRPFFGVISRLAAAYYRGSHVFASVVEDLPYHENRVVLDPTAKNGMRFEYRYPEELLERNRLFRAAFAKAVGRRHRVVRLTNDNNLNWGHVCGTCRFGDDPKASVLNRENRAHDVENLYVVDASFFPSSGGTNPSLTIAANALRVAEAIERRFSNE